MGFLVRMFSAFCVATVIAQMIVVGIMAAKGNLHRETLTQAFALVNGIDVTGASLEKVVKSTQEQPSPTWEEVLRERAMMSQELQMRQDALARESDSIKKSFSQLTEKEREFDRRREEYFAKVAENEKKMIDERLQQVERTIEELAPDQAKEQLVQMLAIDRMDDVVAIIQVMPPAKRKKILGEFTDQADANKLHQVLMRMLEGDFAPTASTAPRKNAAAESP